MDGGIHAREWISPAAVTYILNDLVLNWANQSEYLRAIDWYILPVLNPDGYAYSYDVDRDWRKNRAPTSNSSCVGVDLNRNYDFQWDEDQTSPNPCSIIYGGERPFTEPETLAHKQFFENSGVEFSVFLTFHSYGQYIFYPWAYTYVYYR